MPRRSSSRSSLDVTTGILHTKAAMTSLHHRLAPRQDLYCQHVTGAQLVTGRAANRDVPVPGPLPARLRVVLDEHTVEIHIDEIRVWRLVVERNLTTDRD